MGLRIGAWGLKMLNWRLYFKEICFEVEFGCVEFDKLTSKMFDLNTFGKNRGQGATILGKGTVVYTKLAAWCWSYAKEDRTLLGVM